MSGIITEFDGIRTFQTPSNTVSGHRAYRHPLRLTAARSESVTAFSEAKLGLDLQAWINRTAGGPLKGQPPTTWAQNARLRSCRALRVCRYDSWGAIGDHARIFLASVPKRRR